VAKVEPPLDGYVVVDLSTGIAGAYCTKLLADGGADVVKVEPPEGDPLRSWSASGAAIAPGSDGALFSFLACSKRSVVADPRSRRDLASLRELIGAADAVVWSRGSRVVEDPSFAPAEILSADPHLTVTSITPFGLDGPWCDRAATEFTLQAWSGGIIGMGRGSQDREPVFVGGQVGEWVTGAYAAVGTMLSRLGGLGTAQGELVDVSMLEALAMCLTYYPVTFFEQLGRPFRSTRFPYVPGVVAAMDGLVGLGCGTGQQWLDLCVMVGHPEWMEDESLFNAPNRVHLAPMINEWAGDQTVAEILELATALRIPNAPMGNGANLPSLDHFQARGTFVANPRDGFAQPDRPYRVQPARLRDLDPAPRLGEHTDELRGMRRSAPSGSTADATRDGLPLRGLRVLDMTAFWAGPSCTHPIALLGAEVIHLESISRPDGTRLLGGVPQSEDRWWERGPIFSALNTNKKSLTLDFTTERGRELLRRLIASCDVVVENYTPRVLDQIGLDYESLRALRSDVILVRMPGFGLDGPWRDAAAFAYTIEDASGLTWMTGFPDQSPLEPFTIGDPNAGLHAFSGLLLALEHRRRSGEGVLVEAAMVDAALNITAEQVVEHAAYGALLERAGNGGPTAAPQNLYLSADIDEFGRTDCWVAIAVASDEQWTGLCDAIGQPDWALASELSTIAGRRAQHELVDEHLAAWCRGRAGDDIVERLWGAGVPVGKVMQPHRQVDLAQLQFRRFFEVVDHPVSGRSRHSTLPMRFSRGPDRFHKDHAPLLGEHNRELLSELGLDDSEIDALEADGVIGRAPAMGGG
jgi:crotonobetainyl-CoA:carnitine CoA-transferase CaiB-like acyl-CoA transferase